MKQIAQNYKSGELIVLDVPAPSCRPGGVLVRSLFSLISTGTEMMKLTEAKLSMVGKARARPDQLKKVLDSVTQQGAVSTYKKVMNRLDSYTPLGYSLCGVVTEVGRGAEEFRVGQLVAAAGNEYALHAEYNWVPVNLCVPVPASVSAEHAAFATVGAIAMQGVRRAEVQLGDAACVIGLGLVGQLAVRLLVAAGVRVVGLDTIEDRCRLAEKAGALLCAAPTEDGLAAIQHALGEITEGRGADHVLLAAGGSSNGPVEAAARLARDRARVVDIGKTRLDLPWNAYYDKELDVRFSRSYGPGRYDDRYELDGIDYPAGYVRWTERRNLGCFLDLLAHADIEVDSLVSGVFPMERATEVYSDLASGSLNAVGVLLEYSAGEAGDAGGRGQSGTAEPRASAGSWKACRVCSAPANGEAARGRIHRCWQLRVLDAAAASGQAGWGQARPRRDDAVAVGGQRAAEVRVRGRVYDRRRRARGRRARRDLHRHASPHPRQPRMPRAGDRQGGVRREAARAQQGRAREHRGDGREHR